MLNIFNRYPSTTGIMWNKNKGPIPSATPNYRIVMDSIPPTLAPPPDPHPMPDYIYSPDRRLPADALTREIHLKYQHPAPSTYGPSAPNQFDLRGTGSPQSGKAIMAVKENNQGPQDEMTRSDTLQTVVQNTAGQQTGLDHNVMNNQEPQMGVNRSDTLQSVVQNISQNNAGQQNGLSKNIMNNQVPQTGMTRSDTLQSVVHNTAENNSGQQTGLSNNMMNHHYGQEIPQSQNQYAHLMHPAPDSFKRENSNTPAPGPSRRQLNHSSSFGGQQLNNRSFNQQQAYLQQPGGINPAVDQFGSPPVYHSQQQGGLQARSINGPGGLNPAAAPFGTPQTFRNNSFGAPPGLSNVSNIWSTNTSGIHGNPRPPKFFGKFQTPTTPYVPQVPIQGKSTGVTGSPTAPRRQIPSRTQRARLDAQIAQVNRDFEIQQAPPSGLGVQGQELLTPTPGKPEFNYTPELRARVLAMGNNYKPGGKPWSSFNAPGFNIGNAVANGFSTAFNAGAGFDANANGFNPAANGFNSSNVFRTGNELARHDGLGNFGDGSNNGAGFNFGAGPGHDFNAGNGNSNNEFGGSNVLNNSTNTNGFNNSGNGNGFNGGN
jgi:hypothetical protein